MGRSTLQPFDIIEGAQSPANAKVFVIGAFDSRITLYSQQVRALALVHALQNKEFCAPACASAWSAAARPG